MQQRRIVFTASLFNPPFPMEEATCSLPLVALSQYRAAQILDYSYHTWDDSVITLASRVIFWLMWVFIPFSHLPYARIRTPSQTIELPNLRLCIRSIFLRAVTTPTLAHAACHG